MNSPLEATKSDTLDLKVARGRGMMLYAQKEWFEAEELNWLLVFKTAVALNGFFTTVTAHLRVKAILLQKVPH